MRLFHRMFMIALVSSAAVLPGSAMADEAPPAVAAFLATLERQMEMKASYEAVAADASGTVTLNHLTLIRAAAGEQPETKLTSDTVTLAGLSADGPSAFRIGKLSFAGNSFSVAGKGLTFTATTPAIDAGGWHVLVPAAAPAPQELLLASGTYVDTLKTGKISFVFAGLPFTIDAVEASWAGDVKTGTGRSSWTVANLAIPDGSMLLFDPMGLTRQLGYSGVNLDLSLANEMRVSGQDLGFSFTGSLAGKDIAKITVTASADGIPIEAYLDMLKPAPADPAQDDLQKKLQSATLNGASLRFENASIVGKLLPLYAAATGLDVKTFVAAIPLRVQLALLPYQNEAFTKQVVDAMTRFFAEPQSLTVAARPATPVTLSGIQAVDPAKPGAMIDRLGLSVTAND